MNSARRVCNFLAYRCFFQHQMGIRAAHAKRADASTTGNAMGGPFFKFCIDIKRAILKINLGIRF